MMIEVLVLALCCTAATQDAAKPLPGDAFGRRQGVIDERAREEARELERDAQVLRALAKAQAMREGGMVLGPGVRMRDDVNLSLARATVGRDAPRAAEVPLGALRTLRYPRTTARRQCSWKRGSHRAGSLPTGGDSPNCRAAFARSLTIGATRAESKSMMATTWAPSSSTLPGW